MNDELKDKTHSTKITYIHSDNYLDKHTKTSSIKKYKAYSRCYSKKGSYHNKKIFRRSNYKRNNCKRDDIQKKINYSVTGKSLVDLNALRRQRIEETYVYGKNACQALFRKRYHCIVKAWFIQGIMSRFKEVMRWMAANRKAYHIVDDTELTKVAGTRHHEGICFLIKKRRGKTVQQWISQADADDFVLALEDLKNPYNLGAMIRSCAHFGVKSVMLQDENLLESGAAIRTAEGGAEYVEPIISDSMFNGLEELREAGYTIVTICSDFGTSLFKVTLPRKIVLVLCPDRDGLSDQILSLIDMRVLVSGTGNIDSLNISVSTGILLGEWWRQNKA